MADVKQELPMLRDEPPRRWLQVVLPIGHRDAVFSDLLALLPLLEPEQKLVCLETLRPWFVAWRQDVQSERDAFKAETHRLMTMANEAQGERDAAIKRAEEHYEAWRGAHNRAAIAQTELAGVRAENEKLRAELVHVRKEAGKLAHAHTDNSYLKEKVAAYRAELATVAKRQREACARAAANRGWGASAVEVVEETPLVIDAPSKPRPIPMRRAGLYGLGLTATAGAHIQERCAREIAAWPEEVDREKARLASIAADLGLSLNAPSKPAPTFTEDELSRMLDAVSGDDAAPRPEELCPDGLLPDGPQCPRCGMRRGPSGIGGGTWVHFEPAPPKSRCQHGFWPGGCGTPGCEHGVDRPGQRKHMQHEAVVMANEALLKERIRELESELAALRAKESAK